MGLLVARWCGTMFRPSTRRRRRRRFLLAAAGIILTGVGIVAAQYFGVWLPVLNALRPRSTPPPVNVSVSPTRPACPTTGLADAARLGEVAWIEGGTLMVIDLGTCRQ